MKKKAVFELANQSQVIPLPPLWAAKWCKAGATHWSVCPSLKSKILKVT